MNQCEIDRVKLEIYIKQIEYNIYPDCYKPKGQATCNQSKRIISVSPIIDDEENMILAHELGHTKKISIIFIVISEYFAWFCGYFILHKFKISTKGYWNLANNCLKSYLKLLYKTEGIN